MGKIIWLASYPKSGNTWVRAFLHNLMRDTPEAYDINRLSDLTLGDSQVRWFQQIQNKPSRDFTNEELAALRPQVHRRFTQTSRDPVFVKTHNAVMEYAGAPMISLPYTAAAIYVIRNPLDVVISHSHHYGNSIDRTIEIMATFGSVTGAGDNHVPELHSSWSNNVLTWTAVPNPALHVMRYEDMLDKPLGSFTKLVKFLKLPATRERIERAVKRSSFKVLQEQERQHGFIERNAQSERFFRTGKAGQWRTELTAEQIARVVEAHREQMARFGYFPLPGRAAGRAAGRPPADGRGAPAAEK
jgi:hypothetical protein